MSEYKIITDNKLPNIHPGEILKEEFLDPMKHHGVSACKGNRYSSDKNFRDNTRKAFNNCRHCNQVFKILWNNGGILAESSESLRP